jgi:hypothetical protein
VIVILICAFASLFRASAGFPVGAGGAISTGVDPASVARYFERQGDLYLATSQDGCR